WSTHRRRKSTICWLDRTWCSNSIRQHFTGWSRSGMALRADQRVDDSECENVMSTRRILHVGVCVLLASVASCTSSEPQKSGPPPPPSTTFAITFPKGQSTVDQDIITVRGTGATPNTTVEIDVFTNNWYAQNGTAEVAPDGTWAFGPCYLKGEGAY